MTLNTENLNINWIAIMCGTSQDEIITEAHLRVDPEKENDLIISGNVSTADDSPVRVAVIYGGEDLAAALVRGEFKMKIPLRPGYYQVEAKHRSGAFRNWDVTNPGNGPYALMGKQGQMFLAGDSNDSLGQFTETRSLSRHTHSGWMNIFERFPRWRNDFDLDNLDLMVAPAKEEIFRDYYPRPRAKHTVADDFLTCFSDQEVIFPKWLLWNQRELAYSRTDTHWTDYGATLGAKSVLGKWGFPEGGLPDRFGTIHRIGDLGGKMEPRVSNYEMCFPPEVHDRLVFDNGILNQGCIRVFENPSAPQSGEILIFGDSFGTNLAAAFSGVFSRVTYAYRPAGFDHSLVEIVRPRHVLLQITQRFLQGLPPTETSIFLTIREKVATMGASKRAVLLETWKKAPLEFAHLVRPAQ